jgi:hypothetical protein
LSRNLFVRPPLPINAYRTDAPEYAPKWAANNPEEVIAITQRRMSDPPATILGLAMPGDTIREVSHLPELWTFDVKLQRTASVRFHQFYWPLWHAIRADSVSIPDLRPDPNGFATLNTPAGNYRLQLRLMPPFVSSFYEGISWFGIFLIVTLLGWGAIQEINARRRSALK